MLNDFKKTVLANIEFLADPNGGVNHNETVNLIKDIYNKAINCLLVKYKTYSKEYAGRLMDTIEAKSTEKPIKSSELKKYENEVNPKSTVRKY